MLQDYQVTFHYIKGHKNIVADALSRHPEGGEVLTLNNISSSAAEASWRESLISGYKLDPFCQEIIVGLTDSTAKVSDRVQAKLHRFSYDQAGMLYQDGKVCVPCEPKTI